MAVNNISWRSLKMFKKQIILAGLILLIATGVFGTGIKVSPGAFVIQNVEVGKDHDLGLDLVITNKSDQEQVFIAQPVKPSKVKRKWLKGYSQIPNSNWFYFTKNEISIKPREEGKLRMHLNIPTSESYHNQHWIVYVNVTTKLKKGQMFNLAIAPNYMIETRSKENVDWRPHGVMGLVPSRVGENKQFKIYNNDKKARTYNIHTYIPQASTEKQDISPTPGYTWIEEIDWVKPAKSKIKVKPGKVRTINLNVDIPEDKADQKFEAIVFVEPDEGLAGFVRVLIEPKILKNEGVID